MERYKGTVERYNKGTEAVLVIRKILRRASSAFPTLPMAEVVLKVTWADKWMIEAIRCHSSEAVVRPD